MEADQGEANARRMVTTHASIIQQVTTHFTTLTPRVAPTPAIDPLITWVDDTGIRRLSLSQGQTTMMQRRNLIWPDFGSLLPAVGYLSIHRNSCQA